MNRKFELGFLFLSLVIFMINYYPVSGAVIEDVAIYHMLDFEGKPLDVQEYYQNTEAVMVWVDMSDIHANDILIFEWRPPNGGLYHKETWTVPANVQDGSSYSMTTEMKIQGESAQNLLGKWSLDVYNNDTLWGQKEFYIYAGGTGGSSGDSGSTNDSTVSEDDNSSEDSMQELLGIPSFPVEAVIIGVSAAVLVFRKRINYPMYT